MSLIERRAEIPVEAVPLAEEALALAEDDRLMVLEDKLAGRAWLAGYFADTRELDEAWERWLVLIGPDAVPGSAVDRELPDEEWRDSYKAHFHAWRCGCLHWVPEWERETYVVPEGDGVIWLDPGLAFGTGNHETTRLCCERLVACAATRAIAADGSRRGRVLDAGCGSGILALSAARLGFRDVEGFDNDPEAVRVSRENAVLNHLDGAVRFFTADLVAGLAGREVDLLLANIQADVLCAHAAELTAAVAPGGTLVLSGILAAEAAQVRAVFGGRVPGWRLDGRTLGEWSDLVLQRPSGDAVTSGPAG
jgi:ribosomal protein L11 methyltransferase